MQEEEDDEDDADAEENITLNRRGSRSEGRINITLQDRIAETDRLKKESEKAEIPVAAVVSAPNAPSSKGMFDGMSGVTRISSDNDPKDILGVARSNFMKRPCDLRSYIDQSVTNKEAPTKSTKAPIISIRSSSVDQGNRLPPLDHEDEILSTKFLSDSSTITIPTSSSQQYSPPSIPKYKTMPSPTRSNNMLSGGLNEIYEEGTDVGSSDSATTTPRPVARHTHYINNRSHSHSTNNTTTSRRSKFHKTRTASCSSSDASDDDSENRKKRAHKIVDASKPMQQRRDSHDDSSDSQDPGNASVSGSTVTSDYPIIVGNHPSDSQKQQQQQQSGSNSNGRQKSGQQMGFRRHRAGRRRAGETRLRESQSLNRITEVQESEVPLSALVQTAQISAAGNTVVCTNAAQPVSKPKGFSARLFHGFRKSDSQNTPTADSNTCSRIPAPTTPGTVEHEVEMALGVELAKALKVTESKTSSASKKLKMIGRYFQVRFVCFYFNIQYLFCQTELTNARFTFFSSFYKQPNNKLLQIL